MLTLIREDKSNREIERIFIFLDLQPIKCQRLSLLNVGIDAKEGKCVVKMG